MPRASDTRSARYGTPYCTSPFRVLGRHVDVSGQRSLETHTPAPGTSPCRRIEGVSSPARPSVARERSNNSNPRYVSPVTSRPWHRSLPPSWSRDTAAPAPVPAPAAAVHSSVRCSASPHSDSFCRSEITLPTNVNAIRIMSASPPRITSFKNNPTDFGYRHRTRPRPFEPSLYPWRC